MLYRRGLGDYEIKRRDGGSATEKEVVAQGHFLTWRQLSDDARGQLRVVGVKNMKEKIGVP
jgi:ABC-type taurine transport system ATPase subunit